MKHLYTLITLLFIVSHGYVAHCADNTRLLPYVAFLNGCNTSARDYIIELFEQYDIVILCERDHREMTQYDLILDILADPRFIKDVGTAYFEIGNTAYNDTINSFLRNTTLTDDEVDDTILYFHRNIYGAALWEKSNYSYLLHGVHDINSNLPNSEKVKIYGLDKGVKWECATTDDILRRDVCSSARYRDNILAHNFINYHHYSNTGKALVVLNYRHAFVRDVAGRVNAGRIIKDYYGDNVANVLINSISLAPNGSMHAVHEGIWDASFVSSEVNNVGFDLLHSPFGNDSFDMIPLDTGLSYSDFFHGMVYYTPLTQFRVSTGLCNFVDKEFAHIIQQRYLLEDNTPPSIQWLQELYNNVIENTYNNEFPHLNSEIEHWLTP